MKSQSIEPSGNDAFYALRTRAFQATEVEPSQFDCMLELPSKDSTPVFLAEEGYCADVLKLRWLLGDTVQFVTPHFAYHYRHDELSQSKDYPIVTAVDERFLEWRSLLGNAHKSDRLSFHPSAILRLHKQSDSHDAWAHTDTRIEIIGSKLATATLVAGKEFPLFSESSMKIDVPTLITRDLDLLKKVKSDYPEASRKLAELLRKSRKETLNSTDSDKQAVLKKIMTEVIQPGVEEIKQKQKQILKSQAVTTSLEFVGTVPLAISIASTLDVFIAKLLGSGLGAILVRGVNNMRKSFAELRGDAFYAAIKLKV